MGFVLLLFMIAVPIGEIAVFIKAGELIGLWPTLASVILTAFIGARFLRLQGLGVLRRVQESLARGETPVIEMFDGLCLLIAGALLLTPGFITDFVGFALLVTPFRRYIANRIVQHFLHVGGTSSRASGRGFPPGSRPRRPGVVIDGDYVDITDPADAPDNHHSRPVDRIDP